jgi:hypothetical protein
VNGLKLVFDDPAFLKFASKGTFDLVVGLDAVTNPPAIAKLVDLCSAVPSLSASIFLHSRPRTLFHPKFCWFAGRRFGTLIAGSGNLTMGGLQGNWEAFTVTRLSRQQMSSIEKQWGAWKGIAAHDLLSPADPRVVVEAAKNKGWASRRRTSAPGEPDEATPAEAEETAAFDASAEALVAEIPKAGSRWNQANFDRDSYEKFFGAKVGTQRRIVLRHVNANGLLGELESRPSVEVVSQNYRFELAAASGLSYPAAGGRPVGVFVRQAAGDFLYRLLMPGTAEYTEIAALLSANVKVTGSGMRRLKTSVGSLQTACPKLAIWAAAAALA